MRADAARSTAWRLRARTSGCRINADNSVRIMLSMLEMGQGVMTAMPMLVAEELDVDWNSITTEWAPADRRYGNPSFGGSQTTAGSNSTRGMWRLLREAGASARAMLVTAAAQTWGVAENTLTTEKGEVVHAASGRRAEVRRARRQGGDAAGSGEGRAEGSEGVPPARPAAAASRRAGEGERHRRVRHRRQAARHARRARRALPGVRRHGGDLQRRQGEGCSGREACRPDQHRHRRRR